MSRLHARVGTLAHVAAALVTAALVAAPIASAAPGAPSASPAAATPPKPMASASAAPSTASAPAPTPMAAPPTGMPSGDDEDDGQQAMPAGHPATGAAQGEAGPGMQPPRVPRDQSGASASVPAGTIEAVVLDGADKPLAHVPVMVSLLRQSVAQGDTRSMRTELSDANGVARFPGLSSTSDWSYQVKVQNQASEPNAMATYSTPPFNLISGAGWSVRIHRFPVTTHIDELIAAFEIAVASLEIREDAIDVSMEFNLVNLSPKAWSLGTGLDLALPSGFKGLRAAETMDELKVDSIEGKGARWTGAFAPGQWTVQYDFKLPYDGEPGYDVDLDMPPRVLNAAVRVAGRKGTQVKVDGFDAPREDIAPNGARFMTSMKRGDPQHPIGRLSVHVSGLPEPGPEKWVAILIGLGGLLAGIYALARVKPESAAPPPVRKRMRERILEDLVALEKAHRAGEVGPKGYAIERAKLVDAIADTLADGGGVLPSAGQGASDPKKKGKPSAAEA